MTPSLSQQIRESPGVLPELILFMARRVAGPEAASLAPEAQEWITSHLGPDYEWPGNYRELEQCVRNLLIRKDYRPVRARDGTSSDELFQPAYAGKLTASELLTRYCTLVYSQTGSYEETARRLDIDRRTAKAKIDTALLERLRSYETGRYDMRGLTWIRTLPVLLPLLCCGQDAAVTGERKVWHAITVTFSGPATGEDATPNPFRDYRLNVTFSHAASGEQLHRAGLLRRRRPRCRDVRARRATSGACTSRRIAKASGATALRSALAATSPSAWNPAQARRRPSTAHPALSACLAPTRKAPDFRAKGLLQYVGGHYLRHAGSGEYYLKGGADSPENFLAYADFDGTFDTDADSGSYREVGIFLHKYGPHEKDWRPGDPTWKGGKGKGIIGALNYLAGKGMNSVYFLTYNLDGGDGRDTWMWTGPNVSDRFDVSKLAQWDIVFDHMDRLGLMLHVVTQETENDRALGGGPGLNPIRMLYYRELVARFAHHLAVDLEPGRGEQHLGCRSQGHRPLHPGARSLPPPDHRAYPREQGAGVLQRHPGRSLLRGDFHPGLHGPVQPRGHRVAAAFRRGRTEVGHLRRRAEPVHAWRAARRRRPRSRRTAPAGALGQPHGRRRWRRVVLRQQVRRTWTSTARTGARATACGTRPATPWNSSASIFRSGRWNPTTRWPPALRRACWPSPALCTLSTCRREAAPPSTSPAALTPCVGTTRAAGGALLTGSVSSVQGKGPVSLGLPPSDPSQDWAVLVTRRN